MKEDYLWDKTGENPEIEKLENALKAFRHQENVPPRIPAKVIPFETKSPRKFFRFAFAFAACVAFVVVTLGIWFQISNKQSQPTNEFANKQTPPEEKVIEIPNNSPIEKVNDLPIEKVKTYQQAHKPTVIKARQIVHLKTSAQSFKPKSTTIKLTKEEKYAYDQLMLALSITSSKLRLVKDKVDGIEEQNAVIETEDKYTRRK